MRKLKNGFILFALLLAPLTRAQIVYSGAKNINTVDYPVVTRFTVVGSPFVIDFNNDGIGEIAFHQFIGSSPGSFFVSVALLSGLNLGTFAADFNNNVIPFHSGDIIGAAENWVGPPIETPPATTFNTDVPVPPPIYPDLFRSDSGTQFIGVKFTLDSDSHYGWIAYDSLYQTSLYSPTSEGHILGWAYETQPNVPIVAGNAGPASPVPEPSSYGLASGALLFALLARRRLISGRNIRPN